MTQAKELMANRILDFRGIIGFYSHPRKNPSQRSIYFITPEGTIHFWDKKIWEQTLTRWSAEGYNVVVWYGPNEFGAADTGEHLLCRHEEFPEARELSSEENEKIIAQMKWLFATAKRLGMRNFLYVHSIWVEANRFLAERCNPAFLELTGRPMQERGKDLDELLQIERSERERFSLIFQWPGQPSVQERSNRARLHFGALSH